MAPHRDPISLATWYPLLRQSGVPTPETVIIPAPPDLFTLLDGQPVASFATFLERLQHANS